MSNPGWTGNEPNSKEATRRIDRERDGDAIKVTPPPVLPSGAPKGGSGVKTSLKDRSGAK